MASFGVLVAAGESVRQRPQAQHTGVLLPPSATPRGRLTWARLPEPVALRLCREIDVLAGPSPQRLVPGRQPVERPEVSGNPLSTAAGNPSMVTVSRIPA